MHYLFISIFYSEKREYDRLYKSENKLKTFCSPYRNNRNKRRKLQYKNKIEKLEEKELVELRL